MKTTTTAACDLTLARLVELTDSIYACVEIGQAIDCVRRAVQGSGLAGAHAACIELERIGVRLAHVADGIDEGVTALIKRHEAAA